MKADEVTTPLALVVSVSVFVPFAKVPLAPVVGAVNTTATPLTGLLPLVTVATSGAPKVVAMVVLCVAPPVALMDGAGCESEPQPITKIRPRTLRML